MSLQIYVRGRLMSKEGWCCQPNLRFMSCDACLRFYWMAAVCSSQSGADSIISVKALRASVCILIFRPVCSQLPRGSGAFSLSLFICQHLCSGVTLSPPSHLDTPHQLQLLVSLLTYSGPPRRAFSSHGNCKQWTSNVNTQSLSLITLWPSSFMVVLYCSVRCP